jgi:hypothetical protein
MAVQTITYDSTTDTNAVTITLASLASSTTHIVGRQSTVVSNASTNYVDVALMGQIEGGTTPDVDSTILIYAFAPTKIVSSTISYPVASGTTQLGASDAAATFTTYNRDTALKLLHIITVNATTGNQYTFNIGSLAEAFGGIMPMHWGLFVTHNGTAALDSTAANHWIHYSGITRTST